MVSPSKLTEFLELMNTTNIKYEEKIANVQSLIDQENPSNMSEVFNWERYNTLDEIYHWMEWLSFEYPKNVCSFFANPLNLNYDITNSEY